MDAVRQAEGISNTGYVRSCWVVFETFSPVSLLPSCDEKKKTERR